MVLFICVFAQHTMHNVAGLALTSCLGPNAFFIFYLQKYIVLFLPF